MVRTPLAALALVALSPFAAQGSERRPGIDEEGPPPSPGLSHAGLAVDVDHTIASAAPTDLGTSSPVGSERAYAHSVRLAIEWAVADRRWFLGVASEAGAAAVPPGTEPSSGARAAVFGNPEVWARALWTSRVGLAAGGGLGAVLPLPRSFDADEASAVRAIRVVRPWADPAYQDLALTLRPFLDMRHVAGPVNLQLRQGLDVTARLGGLDAGDNRLDLAARTSIYAGVRVARPLMLGLELHEVYQLTGDVATPTCPPPCDRLRVQFTLAPSVRLVFRHVTPTVSLLLPLSTPLRADVASYVAARIHLGARVPLP
ncbi:MAG: hypothetical protein FJ095_10290 [Deltaproteobacteria bacterium]|nr:hypothetical protein [Deltaproteobacteria bacterium]